MKKNPLFKESSYRSPR